MAIPKVIRILQDKKTVTTKALFWKITHNSGRVEICLKVGRYKKNLEPFDLSPEELECSNPKSELTFNEVEFAELIKFLQEQYEPFKQGFKSFIPVDKPFTQENAEQIKKFFEVPNRKQLIEFISNEEIISADLSIAIENIRREWTSQNSVDIQ